MKHVTLHIIRIPEREDRDKRMENVFDEIMAENFPNLKKGNGYPGTGITERPKEDELK